MLSSNNVCFNLILKLTDFKIRMFNNLNQHKINVLVGKKKRLHSSKFTVINHPLTKFRE